MYILLGFLAAILLFLVWRIRQPGDLRLNRAYVAKYVKDNQGKGPTRIQLDKLPVDMAADQPEERVFYHIEALFSDGVERELTAQIFYPLEAWQHEQDKKKKQATENADPTPSASDMQSSAVSEHWRQDPYKDFSSQEKAVEQKLAQLEAELKSLDVLSKAGVLFPRLINHDKRRHITLTEAVGKHRLDDVLQQEAAANRTEILRTIMEDIAHFHEKGKMWQHGLRPGIEHSEQLISDQISKSLAAWEIAGVNLSFDEVKDILESADSLYETTDCPRGVRLVDSSPRAFFWNGKRAQRVDWVGVRWDVSLFDVVELLCDPAVRLSPHEEMSLIEAYLNKRSLPPEEKQQLKKQALRLMIYFRLVLLGYLLTYVSKQSTTKKAGNLRYWTSEAVPHLVHNLRTHMDSDEEFETLATLLKDKLQRIKG